VQDWVLGSRALVGGLNRYYVTVHFPVTIAFLVWAYVRHHRAYTFIRTWFAVVTFLALAIHVGFPLAPPRMTSGFVDTLQQYGPRIYTADPSRSVANQFAAMPSLHFGWALMLAVSVVTIKRTRRSLLIVVHPFVTLLAIVGTANHFWFDAAVAALLAAAVALVLLARLPRRERAPFPAAALDAVGPVHGPPLDLVRTRAFGATSSASSIDGELADRVMA
jgi:PAP2 superfamily